MLAVTAIGIARIRNLLAVVMLSGIYSLLAAGLFQLLDAVDVALTEAAVGAGIATVLFLGTLAITGTEERKPRHHSGIALLVVTITGAALIYASLDMPGFGKPGNPIHQHVAPRYINDSASEVGVPNIVTSVLASYRGYDTLGEVTVIFTAAVSVLLLLGAGAVARPVRPDTLLHQAKMRSNPILLIVSSFLAAPIWIYAFYVQFHGDYGPGGGFQAGVILATAIILYGLVYGLHRAQSTEQPRRVRTLIAVGLLLYAGVGLISLPLGGNYLDYSYLAPDALQGQHLGIMLVELGVGITVAAVMITVFYSFAGRK